MRVSAAVPPFFVRRRPSGSQIFTVAVLCLGLGLCRAQAAAPTEYENRVDPVLRSFLRTGETSLRASAAFPEIEFGDETKYPCFIQWDRDTDIPLPEGARLIGPGIATARLTRSELTALAGDTRIHSLQAAHRLQKRLDVSRPEIGADMVHAGTGTPPTYSGFTGEDVLIGVVDTGIDFEHLDFTAGGLGRIEALWDQTDASINSPSGFGYGREWTQAELQAGSATSVDSDGHGTHVLGTAAGNGAATGNGEAAYQFVGVAPEASIVVVKTDFWTSSIVDGVDYIFEKADELGLPAVVNLSLGHHYGPHDGTESTDLAIDALVGPGRIVVAAAGNEQESGIHAEVLVGSQTEQVTFSIPSYVPIPGAENDLVLIDGYYSATELLEVTVQTPNGTIVGPIGPGTSTDISTADGWVRIENDVFDPPTADRNFFVQVYDKTSNQAPNAGTWTIRFENTTATLQPGLAQTDMWIYYQSIGTATPPAFVEGMTAAKLVGSPATADSVIAVAAYVTRNSWPSVDGNSYSYNPPPGVGTIAPFSSRGPRRDGVSKPDIAAPGMGIASALSQDLAMPDAWILPDGVHFISQGTSMACPHVSGLVALMFEAFGSLSRGEIMTRLESSARTDGFTGNVPNHTWGLGKIDAQTATASPTPVLLSGIELERSAQSIELRWSVPGSVSALHFRVERATGVSRDDLPEAGRDPNTDSASRLVVAEVGPGPDYLFRDLPLLDSDLVEYWLIPLENGAPSGSYGPFTAVWNRDQLEFALSAPSPNPSREEIRWTVSMPEAGPVRIELFGPQGRRVRTLFDGVLSAGLQGFEWNGHNDGGTKLGSGIYWIRGSSRGRQDCQRVLLLR